MHMKQVKMVLISFFVVTTSIGMEPLKNMGKQFMYACSGGAIAGGTFFILSKTVTATLLQRGILSATLALPIQNDIKVLSGFTCGFGCILSSLIPQRKQGFSSSSSVGLMTGIGMYLLAFDLLLRPRIPFAITT